MVAPPRIAGEQRIEEEIREMMQVIKGMYAAIVEGMGYANIASFHEGEPVKMADAIRVALNVRYEAPALVSMAPVAEIEELEMAAA